MENNESNVVLVRKKVAVIWCAREEIAPFTRLNRRDFYLIDSENYGYVE